uniref:SH3 domain-containing protein n=1 Tax=Mola mola TaxID=94237 RepID=A0A3Q4A9I4_MOLML
MGCTAEVLVLVNFEGTMGDEITMRTGDIVKNVTKCNEEGWLEGELRGKRGIFPANFVKEVPINLMGDSKREPRSLRKSTMLSLKSRKCEVTYAYSPMNSDELQLDVGEMIEIIKEIEDGWWMGLKNDKVGAFPSNFVKEIFVSPKGCPVTHLLYCSASMLSSHCVSSVTECCQVMFDYKGQTDDELDLKKGDVVMILKKETEDEGWWEGELNGRCGFFPDNFVMVVPPVDSLQVSSRKHTLKKPPWSGLKPHLLTGSPSGNVEIKPHRNSHPVAQTPRSFGKHNVGFSLHYVSASEVLEEITKLDSNKSAGYDGFDPMFLKVAANIIAAPITYLFNLSICLSVFPSDWKSAMIFPLFKGGSGSDPNCYTPISILSCLAKVLEKLVHKQLTHFIDSNHILSDLQSGFRTGHGCITSMDNKQVCIAAFLDLAKAFDSVDHNILLRIHLYADDTIIYSSGPSLHSAASTLQLSLTSIEKSFHDLHLRLNSKKTKCMLFDRKNSVSCPPKTTCADSSELEFVSFNKYLGLWLDRSLSFKFHINNLQAKVKARLGFLLP